MSTKHNFTEEQIDLYIECLAETLNIHKEPLEENGSFIEVYVTELIDTLELFLIKCQQEVI